MEKKEVIVLSLSSWLFSTNSSDDVGKPITKVERMKVDSRGTQNPQIKATKTCWRYKYARKAKEKVITKIQIAH